MFKFNYFLISIFLPTTLLAAPNSRDSIQSGEIILDQEDDHYGENFTNTAQQGFLQLEKEEKKELPYDTIQKTAIIYFQDLLKKINNILNSSSGVTSEFSPKVIEYISASYLLCSTKKGVCPEFLDAVFELDFLNSLNSSGNTSCSTLRSFWKSWNDLDMQKKLDHYAKINQVNLRNEFKKNTLPKYQSPQCETRINQLLQEVKSDRTGFFKKRYEKDGKTLKSINFTKNMLIYLFKKHIDVFASTMPH